MKRLLFLLLSVCCSAAFGFTGSAEDSSSAFISYDSLKLEISSLEDSIKRLENTVVEILKEKDKQSQATDGSITWISIFFTLVLGLVTLIFMYFTFVARRDREETRKDLEKLERRFELIDGRQRAVVNEMDYYLDSSLIMFNELLPTNKKLAVTLLKHVLNLRHFEERERFIAIKALGELGDETVIPYLEWAAETDKRWAADAKIAIEDIRKRLAQKQGSITSS